MKIQTVLLSLLIALSFLASAIQAIAAEALLPLESVRVERTTPEAVGVKSKLVPVVFAGVVAFPDVGREVNGEKRSAVAYSWAGGDWSLGNDYSVGFAGIWVDEAGNLPEYVESRPYFGFRAFSAKYRLELALPTKDSVENHFFDLYQLWSGSVAGGRFKLEPFLSYNPRAGEMALSYENTFWLLPTGVKQVEYGLSAFGGFDQKWSQSRAVIGPIAHVGYRDLLKAWGMVGVDVFESSKPVAVRLQVEAEY